MTAAERTARAMGARAGLALRSTGTPTRNPFAGRPGLAKVWRRAYLAGLTGGAQRGR